MKRLHAYTVILASLNSFLGTTTLSGFEGHPVANRYDTSQARLGAGSGTELVDGDEEILKAVIAKNGWSL